MGPKNADWVPIRNKDANQGGPAYPQPGGGDAHDSDLGQLYPGIRLAFDQRSAICPAMPENRKGRINSLAAKRHGGRRAQTRNTRCAEGHEYYERIPEDVVVNRAQGLHPEEWRKTALPE